MMIQGLKNGQAVLTNNGYIINLTGDYEIEGVEFERLYKQELFVKSLDAVFKVDTISTISHYLSIDRQEVLEAIIYEKLNTDFNRKYPFDEDGHRIIPQTLEGKIEYLKESEYLANFKPVHETSTAKTKMEFAVIGSICAIDSEEKDFIETCFTAGLTSYAGSRGVFTVDLEAVLRDEIDKIISANPEDKMTHSRHRLISVNGEYIGNIHELISKIHIFNTLKESEEAIGECRALIKSKISPYLKRHQSNIDLSFIHNSLQRIKILVRDITPIKKDAGNYKLLTEEIDRTILNILNNLES